MIFVRKSGAHLIRTRNKETAIVYCRPGPQSCDRHAAACARPRPTLLRSATRAVSRHPRGLLALALRHRWSSTAAASGRPLQGLAALPKFHMEKLGGWEDAVHQLAASDCEPLTLPELLEHAGDDGLARWEVLSLGYPDVSRGDDALLTELAEGLYGGAARGFGRDNVLGVIPAEGILLAMNALLEHGDHVVVMAPAYASLRSVAEAALGCDISPCKYLGYTSNPPVRHS